MYRLLPFLFFIAPLTLHSQSSLINENGSHIGSVAVFNLELQDNQKLLKANAEKDFSALNFAEPFEVNLNCDKNGSWESISQDRLMWRYRLRSEGATSLNLGFNKYIMPERGHMIIYSSDRNQIAGPFTNYDNKTNGQLWSPIISSDDIIIQVIIPAEAKDEFQLSISKINHGFIDTRQKSISQSCHLDVVCGTADGFPIVDNFSEAINSVGVYSINGTRLCSGALINNTKNNCIPYFLTADHCGITNNNATSVVVHWKYENQVCRQPNSIESGENGNGRLDIFNTGVKIISTYPNSDMMLLELDRDVPVEAEPYFAGWNRTNTPASSSVTIHHPNADEKRISVDENPLTVYADEENFWFVENWEIGSTEGGSSGAPLFNSDQQIIGQIFGGEASCNNGLWDIFGRFDVSWEGDGSEKGGLKSWLDPDNLGLMEVGGRSCSALLAVNEEIVSICNINTTEYSLILNANNGFSSGATLSFESEHSGISVSFPNQNILPNESTVALISIEESTPQGEYEIKFIAKEGSNEAISFVTILVSKTPPGEVTKLTPDDVATVGTQLTFEWQDEYDSYDIQISENSDFSNLSFSSNELRTNSVGVNDFKQETVYYWRVRGINACGIGEWSNFDFETGKIECTIYTSEDLPKIITEDDRNTVISMISVAKNQSITDINVLSIEGKHSWVGDLQFRLEGPSGSEIILLNQECERDRDFQVGFDDSASSTFICPLSDSMTHIPDFPLSTFLNQLSAGEWKLKILDLEEFDGGSFDKWVLEICTNVSKNTVSTDELESINLATFPNPAVDFLFVEQSDNVQNGQYRLYNVVGEMMQSGELSSQIDLVDLNSGIYFLQVFDKNKRIGTQKIIISK